MALQKEKRKIQSIGNGMTFPRDLAGEEDIRTAALALSDKATARLRRHRLKAGGVKIDIKDPRFHVISRQVQLPRVTDVREDIYHTALHLIFEAMQQTDKFKKGKQWETGAPIRLLAVTCIHLTDTDQEEQLSLFSDSSPEEGKTESSREKLSEINSAMDQIRGKFGSGAITYGRVLGNNIGIDTANYADSHSREDRTEDKEDC